MADINEMEERIKMLDEKSDKIKKEIIEIDKIRKLPFFLQIQQKGFESTLERVHDTQENTMEKIIRKSYKNLIKDWKDEFTMFWIGFLDGEYKSINDYLKNESKVVTNKKTTKYIKGNVL